MRYRLLQAGLVIVPILVSSGYAIRQSIKAKPLIGQVNNFSSQGNQWVAVLEEVDNGLGFGQGILYDEIHIRRAGEAITDHGEDDCSTIFYANSMGKTSADRPKIKWMDSSHLFIIYNAARIEGAMPGKALPKYGGIQISYMQAQ